MPARKRNGKKKSPSDQMGTAPTPGQWAKMPCCSDFTIIAHNGRKYTYRVNDIATVLPSHIAPGAHISPFEWWLCTIKDIRYFEEEENVYWAEVEWFYSGAEISELVKDSSSEMYSRQKYERLASEHRNIISGECFEDSGQHLFYYDESAIDGELIEIDDWFCRHRFLPKSKKVMKYYGPQSSRHSKPVTAHGCFCPDAVYDPLDGSLIMHFCPRPSCRRSYHEACLIKAQHISDSSESYRKLVLYTSPFTDDKDLDFMPTDEPPRKRTRTSTAGPSQSENQNNLEIELEKVPPKLLSIATAPAVKGQRLQVGYLNGNIEQVCKARQLVYSFLGGNEEAIEGWEEKLDVELGMKTVAALKGLGAKHKYRFTCPGCDSII